MLFDAKLRGNRQRALAWTFGTLGLLILLLGVVPAPSWTRAEGVVWAPEDALVRAGTQGVIESFAAEPGSWVEAETPLVVLRDPELLAEHAVAEANLRANQAQYDLDRTENRVQAEITRQTVEHAERRLARATEELASLELTSTAAGHFIVEAPEDQIGRFVRRGEVIGYVITFDPLIVRVAVPPESVDLVRNRTWRIDVRLAEQVDTVLPATITSQVPAATDKLPSLALSTQGGGGIALDPSRGQGEEARAFERYFLFDLAVDVSDSEVGVGGRVYVRFAHEPEPILVQLYRTARRLFLSRFNV